LKGARPASQLLVSQVIEKSEDDNDDDDDDNNDDDDDEKESSTSMVSTRRSRASSKKIAKGLLESGTVIVVYSLFFVVEQLSVFSFDESESKVSTTHLFLSIVIVKMYTSSLQQHQQRENVLRNEQKK
jgi:hypothetical protein